MSAIASLPATASPPPVADWITIPDLRDNPFPIFQRLRQEAPVAWVPSVNRYLVTSYAAVHATEMNADIFSANEEGSLMRRAMGHSMLRKDDPDHYIERKAWQPSLSPTAVKKTWAEIFQRNARHYLAELAARGEDADLHRDFAAPYAAENLRIMLGFENATQQDLQRWSQTMIDGTGNYAEDPDIWAKSDQSSHEVDVMLDDMLAWHATRPNNSLISLLLRNPTYRMPLDSIRANIKMTIGGGLNEPRDVLGTAAWALLERPAQRARVLTDPTRWSAVFEEAIRWVAPIGLYSRQTTRAVDLCGTLLPARAKLGICLLSANRDETIWDNTEEFDIDREIRPHLAFGKGTHVCLGNHAARAAVGAIALPMLFNRIKGLRLDPHRPARAAGWVFRGMTTLPVRWDSIDLDD